MHYSVVNDWVPALLETSGDDVNLFDLYAHIYGDNPIDEITIYVVDESEKAVKYHKPTKNGVVRGINKGLFNKNKQGMI